MQKISLHKQSFLQEVDEDNPEHVVLTSGPTGRRANNDNSDEENEHIGGGNVNINVNNTAMMNATAVVDRLHGHIVKNISAADDNANHSSPIPLSKNVFEQQHKDQKEIKTAFEEFSRNFVGYRETRNNRNSNHESMASPYDSGVACIQQLDNMPPTRIADDTLHDVTEGTISNNNKNINLIFNHLHHIFILCPCR